ncbi:MAG TPA: hypothetical protein EYP53_05060, partial [Candidatus Latescibacteria bacterium]|nr:hypothetical protein [Candidatus Latescibacterota bacterium]
MPKVVSRTTVTRKGQTTLPKRIREILNLLRYFTKDGPQKAEQVLKLLKKVERNEEKVITSPLVIFEI